MTRRIKATLAIVVGMFAFALPGGAGADTKWVCIVEGETVTFVTAPDAADHGIRQANATAGTVFHEQFGEDCHVE